MPRHIVCAQLLACMIGVASVCATPLRVDINPDTDRKDVLSSRAENWRIGESPSASASFGPVTATLRPVATEPAARLRTDWWKAGYDHPAQLASDGVFPSNEGASEGLELTLRGLAPGRHTLVTYHNSIWPASPGAFDVLVDGVAVLQKVQPSMRVTHDDDTGAAYVELEVGSEGETKIVVRPSQPGNGVNVILSGFAVDVADPGRIASRPYPARGDEHAPENPSLEWRPAKDATSHLLHLGDNEAALATATPESPEFRGELQAARFATSGLDHMRTWYWRVDTKGIDGKVTRGEVWSFRVRHLAFPGAEGMGRFAIGGRAGRVIEVTNLNDSGPGSLREAVDAEGPRTVVFRVGGAIRLESKLIIRNPYITIAGQTAPGDGIAVHGYTFAAGSTHDVIIRYMRIRVGDESGVTMDGSGLGGCDHSIMDHCSIAWSIDEGFSSRGARNFTLQRSIVGEALNMSVHSHYVGTGKGHGYAGSVSGDIGSIHHNLLAHCAGRNWSLAGGLNQGAQFAGRLDIRNNVVFNWEHRTTDGGVKALNFINNYYIPGPASRVFHFVMPDFGSPQDPQQYFIAGNRMEGRPQYDADNWKAGGVRLHERNLAQISLTPDQVLGLIRLDEPFCDPGVTTESATEAYDSVMDDVGASFPKHDSIDARILDDVRNRRATAKGSKTGLPGIIDSQNDVGGYPTMAGGKAPSDSDHDGMPDTWEKSHNLDPHDPADGPRLYGNDGYTALEVYLNGIPIRNRAE